MQLSGNTILITGGGTGIGRGLAEALHQQGNKVLITGRRREPLDATVAANPGIEARTLDVASAEAIQRFAVTVERDFPTLNVVIHNAGIMRSESIIDTDLADAEATIATNLLGPIRLTAALLPLLLRQAHATLITVSSGLAFIPLAKTPTYCATKAAIHFYTESLRQQLRGTAVEVLELIPPYVQTELQGREQAEDPAAMPLAEFITEVMQILKTSPQPNEICVGRVLPLRFAERADNYEQVFQMMNAPRPARGH